MSKKRKIVFRLLNCIEELLTLFSSGTGCVSIPAFASLVGILIGIMGSAVGLKVCVITTEIKKCKSIIKKIKKRHDRIILLPNYELNSIEVLISKV